MEVKYNRIGLGYNDTRTADPFLFNQMYALLGLQPKQILLDIGCGTGNYTSAFQQKDITCIGMDPSEYMLHKAQTKNTQIDWRVSAAHHTMLPDTSVDGILATLTIHHWQDRDAAFAELLRVAKPGAHLLIFTSTPKQMKGYWLNHYFPEMMEKSIQQMPSEEMVTDALQSAGWKPEKTEIYRVQPDLQDHFLYCGKDRPQLYLDPSIRNGISSFSDLAHVGEVAAGLYALEADIHSGNIHAVMHAYPNDPGDYIFISAIKK